MAEKQQSTGWMVAKLGTLAVGMFAFAIWVMPPLYDVFCDITGINGRTGGPYTPVEAGVDESRTVTVQFVATNNEEMPWEFGPSVHKVKVHPGQPTTVTYFAHNLTDRDMVAQAIPSLAPGTAATYFNKTECFCFNSQPLQAGASAEMPMTFIVDRDLPKGITSITLSYTIFDITDRAQKNDLALAQ